MLFLRIKKWRKRTSEERALQGAPLVVERKKRNIEPFEFSDKGELKWFAFEGEYFTTLLISPPSEKSLSLSVKGDEKNLLKANLINAPGVLFLQTSDKDSIPDLSWVQKRLIN